MNFLFGALPTLFVFHNCKVRIVSIQNMQVKPVLVSFVEVALSLNNNEVNIYGRTGTEWKLEETLQGHDLRVTGIDWAPKTNRIVTCGAVSIL